MKIYKIAQEDTKEPEDTDIKYIGGYNVSGASFVLFRIKDAYWAYQLSFSDWVQKVKQMQAYSSGKALAWAKKNASRSYKVTKDFPMPGSIVEEGKK